MRTLSNAVGFRCAAIVAGGLLLLQLSAQTQQAAPKKASPAADARKSQPSSHEKYEPISTSDFKVDLQLIGRTSWDDNGVVSGGPIASLSFGGHEIELKDKMITGGFISTKDYGKIMLKAEGMAMTMLLTSSQQKKFKELIK
jgi:hypothetical protein